MRLLYVTVKMPFGNGESFLFAEANQLIKNGVELLIVPRSREKASSLGTDQELAKLAFPTAICSVPVVGGALLEFIARPLASLRALGYLFGSRSPKVFLLNLAVFPKALWLSRFARRHRMDHIHAHWCSTTASLALFASAISGIPWSVTAHRGDIVSNNMLQIKFEKASFVRFISESGLNLAKSLGLDFSRSTVRIIHMGTVVPETFQVKERLPSKAVILCPANLLPVKGHRYLLAAIALLKERKIDCLLQVAGEGCLLPELQSQVAELGIGQMVQFLGHLPHPQVMRLYRENKVDLVVLPSVDLGGGVHEGIPVSLIEAMGSGIPVVSTTTGGIPELLEKGAGLLVPPGDQVALADAIERILTKNAERHEFIQKGRARVLRLFAIESVAAELTRCFVGQRPEALLAGCERSEKNDGQR